MRTSALDWQAIRQSARGVQQVWARVLARCRDDISPVDSRWLTRVVTSILLLVVVGHLPWMLDRAAQGNEKLHKSIPMIGDDGGYHIPAVNLIHGYGYSDAIHLPIEEYNLDLTVPAGARTLKSYLEHGPAKEPWHTFNWAPGTSLILAGAYGLFGSDTIVAQRVMALCQWLTAVLLVLTGASLAAWIGSMAGGLAAIYHLHFFPGANNFERILSENPTAFLIALFCFVFSLFVTRQSQRSCVVAAISMSAVILVRANYLPALFIITLYLIVIRCSWQRVMLFVAIALIPVALWSVHASLKLQKFVLVTVQGPTLFAATNNMDTLEGIGPERWNQGGWNPGFYKAPDGSWAFDGHNQAKADENGYVKGLTFWKNHLSRVPQLFYVKLRHGFWFNNGQSSNELRPEGFFLIGIGYLLLTLGFLPLRIPFRVRMGLNPHWLLALQLALICALAILWNERGFGPILIVGTVLLVLSFLRLCTGPGRLPCENPAWFLAFVAAHGITTVLYYGIRFHQPVDPNLILVCLLGILMTLYETFRRNMWLFVGIVSVFLVAVILPVLRVLVTV